MPDESLKMLIGLVLFCCGVVVLPLVVRSCG
jgi:hypothetical protein